MKTTKYFTGPSLSRVVFVSASSGVDAKIHTPPLKSWIAVDLPPNGKIPKRVNGLEKKVKRWKKGWNYVYIPRERPDTFGNLVLKV